MFNENWTELNWLDPSSPGSYKEKKGSWQIFAGQNKKVNTTRVFDTIKHSFGSLLEKFQKIVSLTRRLSRETSQDELVITVIFFFLFAMQILPGMSDILSILPSVNPRLQQPCLQFTYWSIVYMEQTVQGSQVPKRTKHNRSVIGLTTLCLKCVSIFPCQLLFCCHFCRELLWRPHCDILVKNCTNLR